MRCSPSLNKKNDADFAPFVLVKYNTIYIIY